VATISMISWESTDHICAV